MFADRLNSMPKYVVSRSLRGPPEWNATLLEGDLADSVTALKERHGLLIVSGAGELAHDLTARGLVLGEPVPVAGRAADLRWGRAGAPGADRLDDFRLRRAAGGLSAGI
jgi:hypothetical protein